MNNRIKQLCEQSIEAKIILADTLPDLIEKAAMRLVYCLLHDGKIIICGNGGSAANALHFSSAMINRFELERPPLPIIALSQDSTFARQISALGRENDVLIAISTSGQADSILNAVHAATERNLDIIILSGNVSGVLTKHLGPEDIEIQIAHDNIARVRELHLFILHCFCDLIEQSLFGQLTE